jgi:hypothetical protein
MLLYEHKKDTELNTKMNLKWDGREIEGNSPEMI